MPSPKRKIGDIGEGVVCRYLLKRGYTIFERNYLRPWGEIDIVAENRGILRFIEVKSISRVTNPGGGGSNMRPEENMHSAKIRRMHRAIQTYLLDKKIKENKLWQIDLACVYLDFETRKARVELLENIVM